MTTLGRVTGLGARLRRLDAPVARPGAGRPPPPIKRGRATAAALLGLASLGLLLVASVVVEPVITFFVAPVGIVLGWVMGRINEARVQLIGRGVVRRP